MNDDEIKDQKESDDIEDKGEGKGSVDKSDLESSETIKMTKESLSKIADGNINDDTNPNIKEKDDTTRVMQRDSIDLEKEKTIKEMWLKYEEEAKQTNDKSPVKDAEQIPTITLPEKKHGVSKTKKSSRKSVSIILIFVLIVVIGAAIYYFIQHVKNQSTSRESTENIAITIKDQTLPKPDKSKDISKKDLKDTFKLSRKDLQGTAPLKVRESGPVLSEKADAELVAIGNAFKNRVKILYGVKKVKLRNGVSQTSTGDFQGFKVKSTYKELNSKVITDETVISTPSKGTILIRKNVLISVKNTDYEKLYNDLKNFGIKVIKRPIAEEKGVVKVQFEIEKLTNRVIKSDFLIADNRVGKVKVGMIIVNLKSSLPERYMIVEKKMLYEDKYIDTYKVLDENNKSLFFVWAKDNRVWRIQIIDGMLKTKMGIGVSSTLGKLRVYYSGVRIDYEIGEGAFALIRGINGKFILQGRGIDLKREIFPDHLKITSIILGD